MGTVFALAAIFLSAGFVYFAAGTIRAGKSGAHPTGIALLFGRHDKAARKAKVYPARRSPYRATSIVNEQNPCSAVKELLDVRYLDLSKKIPSLPVAGCDVEHCNCKYVHHEDRRDGDGDRRAMGALTTDLFEQAGNENKRSSRGGRRKTDLSRRQIQYSEFDNQDWNSP